MRVETTLLSGDALELNVPDATAISAPVRTSVLMAGKTELEVNTGDVGAVDFYLETTGSELTEEITLRSGMTLRSGALGGGTGVVFVVNVGTASIFGPAPPGLALPDLAEILNEAGPEMGADGPVLRPRGAVTWSPTRTHDLVVSADIRGGAYVLDVRRAFAEQTDELPGAKVTGGTLSRSQPGESRHVILNAPNYVVYGIPTPDTDVDVLVTSMADVTVSDR